MEFDQIFKPDLRTAPGEPVAIPPSLRAGREEPSRYRASAALLQAAKVAVLLNKPVLLTGPSDPETFCTSLLHR
jgi:hypothetical protein